MAYPDKVKGVLGTRWNAALRLYLWFAVLGIILALLTPTKILSMLPPLKGLTSFMTSIVPSIDRVTAVSSFPEVTKLYFSLMWIALPAATVIVMLRAPALPVWHFSFSQWAGGILFFPLLFLLLVYVPFTGIGIEPEVLSYTSGRGKAFLTLMSQYRAGLAVIGTLLLCGTSFSFVAFSSLLRGIFLSIFHRS